MIVYGRKNGKTLRSTLNSVTEVRNGYIYAAATGERIAKIGNVIRRRQQLLRENQDKNNNWKRIHGLPTTRKKRGKTQQTIEKT